MRFERLPATKTGVDFTVPIDNEHPYKRLYAGGFLCGGVAIADFDNDDRPDLFLVNGPRQNRLYIQRSDFKFTDHTSQAGIDDLDEWGTSATAVDIDNDGDQDIYVCNYDSPNRLYLNQGDGTFIESAKPFRLDITDSSLLATFCDYDRDGDLDCYLMTNRYHRPGGLPADMKLITIDGRVHLPKEYQTYYAIHSTGRNRGDLTFIGRPDRLLRNEGNGTFSDVSRTAGISLAPSHGLSATWWDFDDDGHIDLYVGNDFEDPDHLYRNNGDGTFTDVIEHHVPHTTWFSMGADAGDINNDGLFDFVIADMSSTTHFGQKTTMGAMGNNAWFLENARPRQYMRNALYLNSGTARFMEIAYLAGIDSSDWTWSMKFADLDNDGYLDLFVTNGMSRNLNDSDLPFTIADHVGRTKWDLYQDLPAMPQRNLAFRNSHDLTFADVGKQWGLDHLGMSFAAATADFDRDGDLDLVVANLDEPVSIYRNNSTGGNRVLFQLRGSQSNRFGVGAKLRIETNRGRQIRQLVPVSGFLASSEPIVHFGLDDDAEITRLQIDWPSGIRQTLRSLPVNRVYTITEPTESTDRVEPSEAGGETLFTQISGVDVPHIETKYDDFKQQPLLPSKLSQLGPGIAVADVDGDGDDDLYVAGAAGQGGTLCINQGPSGFRRVAGFPFQQDAASEDLAPLFFDADSDGDLDLYVSSGSVECDAQDPVLRDRLYLNDGHGHFRKALDDAIPDIRDSSGAVAAADMDRDGDLDLFVAGRVVPGQYPQTPRSRLLRNNGGRFDDATEELAPQLLNTGMVTAALWSDSDGDGWVDLLVAHEWGPVKWFRNDQGQLVDMTHSVGLDKWLGWWNGLAGGDIDRDGDIDYVATNFGLNTKYHASPTRPTMLYYGDFEGNGRHHLVEAEYEGETIYPVRGRSCSSHAMPFLRDKFESYERFALASLQDIYTPNCLAQSQQFSANTLESGVFLNQGPSGFTFHPLPKLAQASPAFGVALVDLDADGILDLCLAQNFFSPQVETGRMDGGLSLLLKGHGDGTFSPIWPSESGLVVPQDAKGLSVIYANDDAWPDLLIGNNNDRLLAFANRGHSEHRIMRVRLEGRRGNPTAVGGRVTVELNDGTQQTVELHAGSGYLSQSTSWIGIGLGAASLPEQINVRWPCGTESHHRVEGVQRDVVLRQAEP